MSNRSFTVVDHAVSKESFNLVYDPAFDMLKTYPVPDNFFRYYESADYISHTDRKKNVFEKVYHLVKRYTLRRKRSIIEREIPKGHLLDLGAGTADFVRFMQNNDWEATGVEPNPSAREVAGVKGVILEANTNKISSGSIDVITMWHVLEHVPNLDDQMKEIRRLLRPDGLLVVAVPNYKSFDAAYYKTFWAGYDVPRHLFHFSQKSISEICKQNNMKVKKCYPMCFDAYYVSLLSEKYKTGKMNPRAFLIATWSNIKAIFTGEYSSLIYIIRNK